MYQCVCISVCPLLVCVRVCVYVQFVLYDYNTHCFTYAIDKLLRLSVKGMLIMNKEIMSCGLYLHHSKPWKNDGFPSWIFESHNPQTQT